MNNPKTTLAIRHVAFEDLGSFEPVLKKQGYAVQYVEAGMEDLGSIDPLGPDLLVILGGPIGAYEEENYPFICDELKLLEARLKADRPTLGICLGAQMMARALGARVYPGHGKEIGWDPVTLTVEGRRSSLRFIGDETNPVLHWHGDTFDLPDGAVKLASTPMYENQAFSWGKRALALQFHIEPTVRGLEAWFIGHASEIASTKGIDVNRLRAETARHGPAMEEAGPRCFAQWLQETA